MAQADFAKFRQVSDCYYFWWIKDRSRYRTQITASRCQSLVSYPCSPSSLLGLLILDVRDVRQNREVWRNGENNDDITVVNFHPNKAEILLAGGDDGLVSLFDTSIQDEEESLLEAINHGPVHKAGFLASDQIFALSSDQNLALYPVLTPDDTDASPPTPIGDLRPMVPCQYTVDVLKTGSDYVVAAGTNLEYALYQLRDFANICYRASRIDLVKLNYLREHPEQPVLDLSSKHILEPAHGDEVVRAIVIDDKTSVVFTAGEDGQIRAFKQISANQTSPLQASKTTKSKAERRSETRYKPYWTVNQPLTFSLLNFGPTIRLYFIRVKHVRVILPVQVWI